MQNLIILAATIRVQENHRMSDLRYRWTRSKEGWQLSYHPPRLYCTNGMIDKAGGSNAP